MRYERARTVMANINRWKSEGVPEEAIVEYLDAIIMEAEARGETRHAKPTDAKQ